MSIQAILVLLMMILSFRDAGANAIIGETSAPVHPVVGDTCVRQWLVCGPLPRPVAEKAPAPNKGVTDYVRALGGESSATLTLATRIPYRDATGTTRTAAAVALTAKENGIVDLNAFFRMPGASVAYAFVWIDSPADQPVQCFLGSGDGVKVWLDGKLVQEKPASFFEQSCIPRQLHFKANLRKGLNPLLVKVESGGGDWAFILEVAGVKQARKIQAEIDRQKLLKDFQSVGLHADTPGKYIFAPGPFPTLVWTDPALVEKTWGRLPVKVRWFDARLKEVTVARRPGRYAAYVEAQTSDGRMIRRAVTFFCAAPGDQVLTADITTTMTRTPTRLIAQPVWEAHKKNVKGISDTRFWSKLNAARDAAILLAGLSTLKPGEKSAWDKTPVAMDSEYLFRLKVKLGGITAKGRPLERPRRKAGPPAPTLRQGTAREAGVKAGTAKKLHEVCAAWSAGGGQSFTALVARHGVIVYHEAFTSTVTQPVDLKTRYSIDSVTKTVSSMLCAEFLDQGLFRLEDPVGKYLPDLPASGPRSITIHNCLTHTSSLEGHGAWGGLGNPWLENTIANAVENLRPGQVASYNGMGFDLAGRVMEAVTGKSALRLMHEHLFKPLGIGGTLSDFGYTAEVTAEELARLGQVLANRGAYGSQEFFSPATFELMLPRPATETFPAIPHSDWVYGLALTSLRQADPEAGKNGVPKGKTILSPRMFGHGGMSGSYLRVDPENDLVIVMGRRGGGKDSDIHMRHFLRTIEQGLEGN